jgi:hypothetical protein
MNIRKVLQREANTCLLAVCPPPSKGEEEVDRMPKNMCKQRFVNTADHESLRKERKGIEGYW